MTLTLLHKRIKFAENMSIDSLASKFMVVIGVYHTQF